MLKQQVVSTSLGQLTVSSLTLGELRHMDSLFKEMAAAETRGIAALLCYMPVITRSLRRVHPELSPEQLEAGLTLDDFTALVNVVLEVSGLKKAATGEPTPVPV